MVLAGQSEKFIQMHLEDVDINYGRFTYPCRLRINAGAKYLSVQFIADFANRSSTILPVFARWNYGKILNAHVLSICDPTIYIDQNLSLGWYLGDAGENVIPGIVAIAQQCAVTLGIDPELVVYMGSSGGGFAALQAAAYTKRGKAIAINAQTNLLNFNQKILQNYINLATNFSTISTASEEFGIRWDAIKSMKESFSKGNSPKVVLVNNKNDWHYQSHYLPFAKEFDLDLNQEQTITSNVMSILYDGPHAHVAESPEVLKRITSEAIPFLMS